MTSIIKTKHVDNRQLNKPNCVTTGKHAVAAVALAPLLLTGCEAPLNLEGVNNELEKQVRRTDHFQGIAVNDSTIVAIGADGLVLTSPKQGLGWTRHEIADKPALVDIAVCPDQSFVALSMEKKVWFSQDNGKSWDASQLATQEDVLDLTCAPDNSVWVVGSFSTVIHSKDQGKNWSENTMNEDAMLTGIQFVNAQTAFITGEFGLVSRSDDGGASWNPPEYIPNDFYTQGAYFKSESEGWVAGLSGQILYTQNGGVSWTKQNTPTESPLYGFYPADQRLFAFGDHATLLEFNGMDWQRIENKAKPVFLRSATKLNNGELLMAGGFGSLYSLDLQLSPAQEITKK